MAVQEGNLVASHPAEKSADGHPVPAVVARRRSPLRWLVFLLVLGATGAAGYYYGIPWYHRYLSTTSTDDAFVSGHVSYVSARIQDTVEEVLVDDNDAVEVGQVLVRLDRVPFQLAVEQKKALLEVAKSDLAQSKSLVRAEEAKARSASYKLYAAQEQIRYQQESLKSNVATLKLQKANRDQAQRDYDRAVTLLKKGAGTREDVERRWADLQAAKDRVDDAMAMIQRTRAGLGLGSNEEDPLNVPADLAETASDVQAALSEMVASIVQLGVPIELDRLTPEKFQQLLQQRVGAVSGRDLNTLMSQIVEEAPATLLAKAKVVQAERDLEKAMLDLGYTEIKSPIAGYVNKRSVNAGNQVVQGQSLMAIRSLDDIWIDANFKETELADLRIGQPVDIEVDAYPTKVFKGRVAGFSPGTGASLSLLPPENATGNFVKVVQRLPVRIELIGQNPRETPLFVGLSVAPIIHLNAKPEGPNAGKRLRAPVPKSPTPR